jgi:hypothetical protein
VAPKMLETLAAIIAPPEDAEFGSEQEFDCLDACASLRA